jgi:hypothetical protein
MGFGNDLLAKMIIGEKGKWESLAIWGLLILALVAIILAIFASVTSPSETGYPYG